MYLAVPNGAGGGEQTLPHEGSMHRLVDDLHAIRRRVITGDEAATRCQHGKGRLTARERIALLLDDGSFGEIGPFRRRRSTDVGAADRRPHTDGVVTGSGRIDGRPVVVYAQDFRIFGGALGEAHAEKIQQAMDLALRCGVPVIGLCDGAGARIQEGVAALAGYGGIFERNVRASGVIPQISVILGPCAGGAAYSPALSDFVFMVRGTSHMFLTGPDVIEQVTGERPTHEQLGGADMHGSVAGTADFVYDDEESCLEDVRWLIGMLPANNRSAPPPVPSSDPSHRRNDALLDLVSTDSRRPYDMLEVIGEIVDDGEIFEVHQDWGPNLLCCLVRLAGHVVGVVANQPRSCAGVLDADSSTKGARFVQMCDAFNIPLVTLVDAPGFLPGIEQERGGILRHGAKLLYAYCNATVPRVQLILRKAFGGAYIVMDSPSIGCDLSFAWPSCEIAVMGPEAAANLLVREGSDGPVDVAARRAEYIADYRRTFMHPYCAAEGGFVDDVIDPRDSRAVLIRALDMLRTKSVEPPLRKHGNPPQ